MVDQRTLKHVLSGAALVASLATSTHALEVRGPDPRHAWDYWPERKSAYLGAEGTDDVPVSFTCKESGTVEGLFSGAVSSSATDAKNGAKVGLTFRQSDGTELKFSGTLQENPFSDEVWDLTVRSDVRNPMFDSLKGNGTIEIEVERRFQDKNGYKQRVALKGARQAIEKLQNSCSGDTQQADTVQSGRPDDSFSQQVWSYVPTRNAVVYGESGAEGIALDCKNGQIEGTVHFLKRKLNRLETDQLTEGLKGEGNIEIGTGTTIYQITLDGARQAVEKLQQSCRKDAGSTPVNSAEQCPLISILSGETRLATVKHSPEPPYPGYETLLIRNNARDSEGILTPAIKGELVPQRWGFDLQKPAGERVGLVSFDGLTVDDPTEGKSCEKHKITLRPEKGSAVAVLDHGKRIGLITAFPRKLLQR